MKGNEDVLAKHEASCLGPFVRTPLSGARRTGVSRATEGKGPRGPADPWRMRIEGAATCNDVHRKEFLCNRGAARSAESRKFSKVMLSTSEPRVTRETLDPQATCRGARRCRTCRATTAQRASHAGRS